MSSTTVLCCRCHELMLAIHGRRMCLDCAAAHDRGGFMDVWEYTHLHMSNRIRAGFELINGKG